MREAEKAMSHNELTHDLSTHGGRNGEIVLRDMNREGKAGSRAKGVVRSRPRRKGEPSRGGFSGGGSRERPEKAGKEVGHKGVLGKKKLSKENIAKRLGGKNIDAKKLKAGNPLRKKEKKGRWLAIMSDAIPDEKPGKTMGHGWRAP